MTLPEVPQGLFKKMENPNQRKGFQTIMEFQKAGGVKIEKPSMV